MASTLLNNVALISVLILVLSISVMPTQSSLAASRSVAVVGGENTITYRDIENLEPTPTPVLSLDKPFYFPGETAILTIDDFNANLDINEIDSTSALVNSQTVPLTETVVNSHVFVGSFIMESNPDISYTPDPPESARAQVTLGVGNPGDVIISDHIFDENELANLSFTPVGHALNIELANGATLDGTNAVVTLSYANALIDEEAGESAGLLQMYYSPPGGGWNLVTDVGDFGSHDEIGLTVTSNPEFVLFSDPVTAGLYVLGFDTGGAGGGAGGLVRPGLVLNFLASMRFSGGGLDSTPPSLTRTFSSTVQFDPFEPITPTSSLADTSALPPLRINQNGYNLYGYSNTIVTNTIETGQFTDMSLAFEEASKVEHVAVYFVDQGKEEYSDRDPALIFDNGNIAKVDPQGIFGDDIQMSTSKEGTKSTFNFGMSFDKPTNKHIIIVAWDDKRNVGVTKVFNALQVVGNEIPNEVAHFMPIEALGEFDLVKDDNGQYVLSQPIEIQTVANSPQTFAYPEFIGRMERHEMKALYDSKDYENYKASSIMAQKFKLDTKLFADDNNDKPSNDLGQAAQLTWSHVGHKFRDLANTSENKDLVHKLMWEEHLKAEKILKAYLEQRHHVE